MNLGHDRRKVLWQSNPPLIFLWEPRRPGRRSVVSYSSFLIIVDVESCSPLPVVLSPNISQTRESRMNKV